MTKIVHSFQTFLVLENLKKFDIHKYNKDRIDPTRQELKDLGVVKEPSEPEHHKYLQYMKMEIDDAKKYMDEMDYDQAEKALDEVQSMLNMIGKAVRTAYLEKQEEEDRAAEQEEENQVTEEEKPTYQETKQLIDTGMIPYDPETRDTWPEYVKLFHWIKQDANYMFDQIEAGKFKSAKWYADEIEWLLSKVKTDLARAAAEAAGEPEATP